MGVVGTAAHAPAAHALSKRSLDRRSDIAAAAAKLFVARGYHRVRVEDVGAEVGLSGAAIYRHFESKRALLETAVAEARDAVNGAVQHDLGSTIAALAALFTRQRYLGVLLQRETRGLALPCDGLVQPLVRLVAEARPECSAADARFVATSIDAAVASIGYHAVDVGPRRCEELLREAALAAAGTTAVPRQWSPAHVDLPVPSPDRASRREALLTVAVELFAARGYPAVRMEDVGAAAGIAGPSIYEHFAGKPDLLVTALTRGADLLQVDLTRALNAGDGLAGVVRSYVECSFGHPALIEVLLNEVVYLPAPEQHTLRRVQHAYVAEWVHLLGEDAEAWVRAHAAIGIINTHVRDPLVQAQPERVELLVTLALEILGGRR